MTKDLVIIGHGGLAREVVFLVEALNQVAPAWNLLGHVGSSSESVGQGVGRHRVIGDDHWLAAMSRPIAAVLAIGNPALMSRVRERFRGNRNIEFPNLVHPSATGDWRRIAMAEGNLVLNGTAFTTDIALGSFNIVNPGCTLSHDCGLGNHNLLGPGVHLAGAARIGSRVLLGVGAQVLPGVAICDEVVVGAGAVVVASIDSPGTYVGVPARRV